MISCTGTSLDLQKKKCIWMTFSLIFCFFWIKLERSDTQVAAQHCYCLMECSILLFRLFHRWWPNDRFLVPPTEEMLCTVCRTYSWTMRILGLYWYMYVDIYIKIFSHVFINFNHNLFFSGFFIDDDLLYEDILGPSEKIPLDDFFSDFTFLHHRIILMLTFTLYFVAMLNKFNHNWFF